MSLPHGFKAKANRIALSVRHQTGKPAEGPVDLLVLAQKLRLTLVPLRQFQESWPQEVAQLGRLDRGGFSAVLLTIRGERRIILYNDTHIEGRRNSSIAHEISHALLVHPTTMPFDETGSRRFDQDIEDEANCLGGHILISNEAAMFIVTTGLSSAEACQMYGVSNSMLEHRLNVSGARIRHRRSRMRFA